MIKLRQYLFLYKYFFSETVKQFGDRNTRAKELPFLKETAVLNRWFSIKLLLIRVGDVGIPVSKANRNWWKN